MLHMEEDRSQHRGDKRHEQVKSVEIQGGVPPNYLSSTAAWGGGGGVGGRDNFCQKLNYVTGHTNHQGSRNLFQGVTCLYF